MRWGNGVRAFVAATGMMFWLPASASQFFCAATHSTGFRLNDGKWRSVDFNIEPMRYVIAPDGAEYTVTKLGQQFPFHRCQNTMPAGQQIHLICGGLGYGWLFSERTLRFQEYYGIGYIDGEDKGGNTPSITIGTCSRI